ncbi:MAG: FAD-dependent oxidoreductase [Anaerolineae bacterium]|jgi:succinate dehydrogenase/fumarate reductase flavoprotein subunit
MSDQKRTTRRGLLKGAAVTAGAAAAASLPVGAAAQDEKAGRMEEADVLVVGMGFAGLVAGIRAAQLGADVVIIDKMPQGDWIGGSMMLSGQSIHVAGSSPMLPDEELREIITTRTAGRPQQPYAELIDAYLGNVKRGMQWLMDLGVEFEEEPGQERRLKPAKVGSFAWGNLKPGAPGDYRQFGGYLTARLLENTLADLGARMLYETKAQRLLTDETGAIAGVFATDPDGALEIRAKATILATGGFARNREMSAKYMGPHGEEIPVQACPGATGDGHRMALEVGAAMKNMSYSYWWPCPAAAEEDPWHDTLGFTSIDVPGTQGIIVTVKGERYCDESLGRFTYGAELFRQGYVKGLMVFDDAIAQMDSVAPVLEELVGYGGTLYQADTIEDLAAQAGVSPYLATTVAEFNAAVDDGTITTARVPKTDKINKIETPPFYGIPFIMGTLFHYGGLMVNTQAQVLDNDSEPIPGLYAIGELIVGALSGGSDNQWGSYTGILAGGCLTYGLLAAEAAVETIKTTAA